MFDTVFGLVVKAEGPWDAAAPTDPGGDTCFGITRTYEPGWAGWPLVAALLQAKTDPDQWRLDTALMAEVHAYYWSMWVVMRMDQITTASLQGALFGGVVNQGPKVIGWLQAILGIPMDEHIGPGTIAAIHERENAGTGETLTMALSLKRIQHYAETAQPIYVRGLILRVFAGA